MSTTNVSAPIPSLVIEADPVYGSVFNILKRDYIGSWADATMEYSRIRRDIIWAELRSLTAAAYTKTNQDKVAKLLKELQSISADLCDTSPSSGTSFTAAESVVKLWTPAPSSGPKPAPKKVVNTFAALADSDEDDE